MAALTGVRVLDLTWLLPGPYGTMLLADQGAEVIKIEPPATGDPLRQMQADIGGIEQIFAAVNRGKRSVTLNLRSEPGQMLFHRLLETADVLVEGFRPGVMARLGLAYETLAERYPTLVYCSITGFGRTGRWARLPGHDLNYLGWAGLLPSPGAEPARAVMPPTLLADLQAGLCAAFGIGLALLERARTGRGRLVDIEMTRSLAPFLLPGSGGVTSSDLSAPWFCGGLACYNVYRTSDGRLVTLAALESRFWRAFCAVAGRPDLAEDHLNPARQAMLHHEVAALIGGQNEAYWLEVADRHDVCLGPVRTQAEALADRELCDAGWPGPFPSPVGASTAPNLGADTTSVLVDQLGCDPEVVHRAQTI